MMNIYNEYLPATAMACFILAAAVGLIRGRKNSDVFSSVFLAAGSLACVATLVLRGQQQDSIPLRSMFEIFTLLGALIWPISIFCDKVLDAGAIVVDGVIGAVLLIPAVFVFDRSSDMMPAILKSPLFVPHVMAYMVSYLLIMRAAVFAVAVLFGGKGIEKLDSQLRLAFPFMTGGLILGSIWGKMAWGDWWNWDPKELWSLAAWCTFVGYLYLRSDLLGKKYPRAAACVAIIGFVFVVLTLVWVNLSRVFDSIHSYV